MTSSLIGAVDPKLIPEWRVLDTWRRMFPEIAAWFRNGKERRPYRWGDILFRKADWSGRGRTEVV